MELETQPNEAEVTKPVAPVVGDIVQGVITRVIRGTTAFIDINYTTEAYINLSEFRDEVERAALKPGDEIKAQVVSMQSGIQLSRKQIEEEQVLAELEQARVNQTLVEGTIVATNRGGYELRIRNQRAFCPNSQFSLRYERNPQRQIGLTLPFLITEISRKKSVNIVASRRSILEAEEDKKAQRLGELFTVGEVIQGRVSQLTKFGVFVEVSGQIEGLIPMSELSHTRVEKASDVVNEGDAIEVKVLAVEPERKRLTLSIRQLTKDPWETFVDEVSVGNTLKGTVNRLVDFGVFVQLAPHVEGLLHIGSISSTSRVNHPSEYYEVGQEIEIILEEIIRSKQADRRRLRLMTPEVAESRKPIDVNVAVGEVITVKVIEVKEQGLSVQIASNLRGFIPSSETGTARGSNLNERFPINTEITAKIITIDLKRGRVRLSIKALENHEEEMAFKSYKEEMASQKMGKNFGSLLKDFLK